MLAERVVSTAGSVRIEQVAAVETDDRGEYRLFGLPAGRFVVAMLAGRTFDVNSTAPMPIPSSMLPPPGHFYPNAATAEQAEPIAIASGDDVVGINPTIALPPSGMLTPQATPSARTVAGGIIRGRVARADGRPLRRARVRLSSDDTLPAPSVMSTDDDGRFEFRGVKAGVYRVAATSLSFQTVKFGRNDGRGDAVLVEAGALVDHVDMSMPRTSAISGRVQDEYGDPMANANVRVQRIAFSKGRRRLVGVKGIASHQTNDLGGYRIFGLPPGHYVVSAVVSQAVNSWETEDWPGYAPTFFPATTAVTDTQEVEVSADQDRLNVDIALVRGHIARVAGHAFTASGEPMDGTVWLSPSYRSGAVATTPVSTHTQPDGAFAFTGIPPGEYVMQAGKAWVDPATEGEFVANYITLNGVDVTNIDLRMMSGSTITGHLTFDGGDPPDPEGIEVSAVAVDPDLISLADNPVGRAAIRDDATFELGGVNGSRLMRVLHAPAGWMLKSVLVNGLESADTLFSFGTKDQSLSDVELILTRRIGEVSGVVADDSGRPVAHAAVIAFPTDRAEWQAHSRFIAHTTTTSSGAFTLTPLPPGSYYVAAIDPPEDFEENQQFDDPALLGSLAQRASRLTITDDDRRSLPLSVIRAAKTHPPLF